MDDTDRIYTELRYARALMSMQPYITEELKLPQLSAEPRENILQVLRAAHLISGETIELDWTDIPIHPTTREEIPVAGQPFHVVFDQDLNVTIGTATYFLGSTMVVAEAAQLGACEEQPDGTFYATLVPALGKTKVKLAWRGEESIQAARSTGGGDADCPH